MSPTFIIVIAIISFTIGLGKGGLGAPLIILALPVLSQIIPVGQAQSTLLPMLLIADVFALWAYWKTWDMHYVKLLSPLAIIGVILGTYMLAALPNVLMRQILGLLTLLFVVYQFMGLYKRKLRYEPRNWHGHVAGFASGIGSALANTGAPPFTAYMLLQEEISPQAFVGTMTLFFALLNWVKLPSQIFTGLFDLHDLLNVVWALPLLPLGVWVGRWVVKRIDRVNFERLMLVVLAAAGLALLLIRPR